MRLDVVAPAARVRRRVGALVAEVTTEAPVDPWPARVVERWCLPVEPGVVRAIVVGVPSAAVIVGGLRFAALAVMALALTAAVLARGVPARRAGADERELPEALERVARHLRSGGSLTQAIGAAAPVGRSPLAASWRSMVERVPAVGVVAALEAWALDESAGGSRRLAGAALALAASTGGSPARAVDGVAATLRARLAVADEIRALSSQARASAAVIALAPVVFGLVAGATDDRTGAFFATPAGAVLLAGGLGLDGLGAAWMARLCRRAGALP